MPSLSLRARPVRPTHLAPRTRLALRSRPVFWLIALWGTLCLSSACSLAAQGPESPSSAPADSASSRQARQLTGEQERLLREEVEAAAARIQPRLVTAGPITVEQTRALLTRFVAQRVEALLALEGPYGPDGSRVGYPVDDDVLRRQVVGYEAFKLVAYVGSGVFPKRYFGYVDERWDSAVLETRFLNAVQGSRRACNQYLEQSGSEIRVTDAEIALTWIAEGGALLLGPLQDEADRVHPVLGMGLDHIAFGTRDLPELVRALDETVDTGLGDIVRWVGDDPRLRRWMDFEETVTGTALMWVWEKQIADRKLREQGRPGIASLSADHQFIVGSLVYNSGIVHDPERPGQIQAFQLADHLAGVSERNASRRPELPLGPSAVLLEELLSGGDYREQPTSWVAMYHILQRYGGYRALLELSDLFDEHGMLVGR